MANSRGLLDTKIPGQSGASGIYKDLATMLDGTQFNATWLQKMILDGNVISIHAGTQTAPISGNGVFVNTTPDLDVNIPAGLCFIPTFLMVNYETVGTSGIQECLAVGGTAGTFATSGTLITPINKRLDSGNTFGITARSGASSAVFPTTSDEFFRNSPPMGISKSSESATVSSIDPYNFTWSILTHGNAPTIYDPSKIGRVNVWMGGQAPTGFIKLEGVVLPLS